MSSGLPLGAASGPRTGLPRHIADGPFAVQARCLAKRYGSVPALDTLDLTVPEGGFYLLVGPNGAGKSTLLRILLDLVRSDVGEVRVLGLDPAHDGPALRANVGYVPEDADAIHPWMEVRSFLDSHASYFPTWDPAYAGELLAALELSPRLRARIRTLSKGQRRALHLVTALAHRPALLLLDEPTEGLDPLARDRVAGLLAAHLADRPADRPVTCVVATHHVHEADRLADSIGILRAGRVVAQVRRDELERQVRGYRAVVPEGWAEPAGVPGVVLRRNGDAREIRWTVWGDEEPIRSALTASGARVDAVSRLSLEQCALELMAFRED